MASSVMINLQSVYFSNLISQVYNLQNSPHSKRSVVPVLKKSDKDEILPTNSGNARLHLVDQIEFELLLLKNLLAKYFHGWGVGMD